MALPLFRHVGLKVVSIALAALLWVLVAGEQIVERALRIPLEFTNLPAELELVGEPPNVVDVRIRGSSGALSRIATGELVAVLDLEAARSGQRLFHLTGDDVRAPFGVQVVQVTPSTLSLALEPSATKAVPVKPAVEGEPADGFVLGTVTADPPMVEVVGPKSALDTLTEAMTESVSVTGAAGPVTESVTVGVFDPSVRLKTPQSARVTVNVSPAPVEWAIGAVQVQILEGGEDVVLLPGQVTVHVRGPRETMRSGAEEFDASVNVGGLGPGQYVLPVRVVPPPRVGVVRVEPAQVRVRIR